MPDMKKGEPGMMKPCAPSARAREYAPTAMEQKNACTAMVKRYAPQLSPTEPIRVLSLERRQNPPVPIVIKPVSVRTVKKAVNAGCAAVPEKSPQTGIFSEAGKQLLLPERNNTPTHMHRCIPVRTHYFITCFTGVQCRRHDQHAARNNVLFIDERTCSDGETTCLPYNPRWMGKRQQ